MRIMFLMLVEMLSKMLDIGCFDNAAGCQIYILSLHPKLSAFNHINDEVAKMPL